MSIYYEYQSKNKVLIGQYKLFPKTLVLSRFDFNPIRALAIITRSDCIKLIFFIFYHNILKLKAELKLVVCDNSTKAMALLTKKSNLKYLVVIEEITEEVENIASEKNIQVMSFEALKDLGAKNLKQKIVIKKQKSYIFLKL